MASLWTSLHLLTAFASIRTSLLFWSCSLHSRLQCFKSSSNNGAGEKIYTMFRHATNLAAFGYLSHLKLHPSPLFWKSVHALVGIEEHANHLLGHNSDSNEWINAGPRLILPLWITLANLVRLIGVSLLIFCLLTPASLLDLREQRCAGTSHRLNF